MKSTSKKQVAAVYLRVSTKKQADTGTAISGQKKGVMDLCARENIHIYKFYVDEGLSGTTTNRPALQQLLAEADRPNPPFTMIMLWDVSRLDRDFKNWINHIYTLNERGIH